MDIIIVLDRLGYLAGEEQSPSPDLSTCQTMVATWRHTTQSPPTEADILAEWAVYLAEQAATQYIKDRAAAYKPIPDQLDMIFWDKENGTELWLEHIREVKEAHEKPT